MKYIAFLGLYVVVYVIVSAIIRWIRSKARK